MLISSHPTIRLRINDSLQGLTSPSIKKNRSLKLVQLDKKIYNNVNRYLRTTISAHRPFLRGLYLTFVFSTRSGRQSFLGSVSWRRLGRLHRSVGPAQPSHITRVCGLWLESTVFAAMVKEGMESLAGVWLHSRYLIKKISVVWIELVFKIECLTGLKLKVERILHIQLFQTGFPSLLYTDLELG